VVFQLRPDQGAELRVDGGQHLGELLTWVTARPRAVSASAISRPMYPAPTITADSRSAMMRWARFRQCGTSPET
jgi:hypothetical protein